MLIHALAALVAATTVSAPQDTAPKWSPTGASIAFDRAAPTRSGVYRVPFVGGKALRLAPGELAGWRPDGAALAALEGENTRILARNGRAVEAFRGALVGWSPDGTRTAWVTDAGLYVGNADARNGRRIASSPVTSAAWSPDGTRLAFTSNAGVTVVNADGTDLHSVYGASLPSLNPSWSFDSKTIAFETQGPYWHIALAASDGSSTTPLEGTHAAWNDRFPVWAPFTPHLAFVSDRGGTPSKYALYVDFMPSGSTRKEADDVNPTSPPSWSPDARRLAYSARRGCARWAIFVKLYGARTARRLTNTCRSG